jgi:Phage capsid family.
MRPDVAAEILSIASVRSAVLALSRRAPDMPNAQRRMPVIQTLPFAYFVTGDTGMKQTTEVDWTDKYLNVEEIATIVPIPENVVNDASYDMWGQIRPLLEDAVAKLIDTTILYAGTGGVTKPASWPNGIVTQAVAAGNSVDLSAVTVGPPVGDLYTAILEEDGVYAKVEEDGFVVTGNVGALTLRAALRGTRDSTGQPIFIRVQSGSGPYSYELDGAPILFPGNGAINPAIAPLISGDFAQLIYAFRQDITYKILTEGVITDNGTPPTIIYNLPQQDMVALRLVLRMAWQIPNPPNYVNTSSSTRFPFAVLVP